MTQDYVVLRLPASSKPETLGTQAAAATVSFEEVEIRRHASLTPKEVIELKSDPCNLPVPQMPVELIAPVELTAEDQETTIAEDSGKFAWGLEATGALASQLTGNGVTVAVLDSGIDREHEAFAAIRDRIVQEDFTGEGTSDHSGHGTHCAGTIFGGSVGGVRIGVASGIKKALIGKVLAGKPTGTQEVLDGIQWALRNGANVISMSIGFNFHRRVESNRNKGMPLEAATSKALEDYRENVRFFDDLANMIESHSKVIVIAAAGNASNRPDYEIGTTPPAIARGFVSVGALRRAPDNKFRVAAFSNARPVIAAPGADIRSARLGGGLKSSNGTSMATPHVAGIAALWLESIATDNSNWQLSELRSRLISSGTKKAIDKSEYPNVGSGMVTAPP